MSLLYTWALDLIVLPTWSTIVLLQFDTHLTMFFEMVVMMYNLAV